MVFVAVLGADSYHRSESEVRFLTKFNVVGNTFCMSHKVLKTVPEVRPRDRGGLDQKWRCNVRIIHRVYCSAGQANCIFRQYGISTEDFAVETLVGTDLW